MSMNCYATEYVQLCALPDAKLHVLYTPFIIRPSIKDKCGRLDYLIIPPSLRIANQIDSQFYTQFDF